MCAFKHTYHVTLFNWPLLILTPDPRGPLSGKMRIKAPVRAAWRDSMNPDVRLDEQKGLEKLQARSNFLKTKRFGPDQVLGTYPHDNEADTVS